MLTDIPLNHFLSILSSDAPAPGGGSAAALTGALGASLITMVCRLSIGRRDLEPYQDDLLSVLEEAAKIRNDLSVLLEKDTDAFNQVMEALKMRRTTNRDRSLRASAILTAVRAATDIPLQVSRQSCLLLELSLALVHKSNPNVFSDLGVAAQCCYAGTVGGLLNVGANLRLVNDADYASMVISESQLILMKADSCKKDIDLAIEQEYFGGLNVSRMEFAGK